MRYFVIRPFGTKEGIDFDRVDEQLIQPAFARLRALGRDLSGGTTGAISRQGNIREDMFRLIALADLVIADVSIHNANAFYELGMRHALRPAHTFLIRCKSDIPYPFDLQTDRYFLYDATDPGASVDAMAQALHASLAGNLRDSPVFALLPELRPHARSVLIRVPARFRDAVDAACSQGQRGDLLLLADDISTLEWAPEGLRLVGSAQLKIRADADARNTFDTLLRSAPDDLHAGLMLGTIYQRMAQADQRGDKPALLMRSEQAVNTVLAGTASREQRCEAWCLLGSNEKLRWRDAISAADRASRQEAALQSPHLAPMLSNYLAAAKHDLNAHYPAINALGFLTAQRNLAHAHPALWEAAFPDAASAKAELKARVTLATRLQGSLALALDSDHFHGTQQSADTWTQASHAEYLLLTSPERPARVQSAYRAMLAGADQFAIDASRRNLDLYRMLGQFEPAVSCVLALFDTTAYDGAAPAAAPPLRAMLFSGHMLDAADQPPASSRFPRDAVTEARARELIRAAVAKEVAGQPHRAVGMAGGACGGDILFHEVCQELGVPSVLLLALPFAQFEVTSVQRGGADWVERYRALYHRLPMRELQRSAALPDWLADQPEHTLWQRANRWMMYQAMATGARELTVIALLDPSARHDGAGGTRHMLDAASIHGFKPVLLDATALLKIPA